MPDPPLTLRRQGGPRTPPACCSPLTLLCSPLPRVLTLNRPAAAKPASGRRTSSSIPATPEPAGTSTSSATSASSLRRTESVRGADNRRHRPGLLRPSRRRPRTIPSPPSLLRPHRPLHRAPGELVVLRDLSSLSLPSCPAVATAHRAPLPRHGHRSSLR